MTHERRFLVALIAAAVALSLASCGKKPKELDPPDGGKSDYPREYPASK